ncbi:hypothetical protein PBI_SCTP2_416 [Salicola phage SCTP-2]|nr:hypothetical protein PBI_SCTP2_416 [Salicola phage SCTP-2]
MGKTHQIDYQKAFDHAKHDVFSDAECAVLRLPKIYKRKYKELSERNNISDEVKQGYMDGIDSAFYEL